MLQPMGSGGSLDHYETLRTLGFTTETISLGPHFVTSALHAYYNGYHLSTVYTSVSQMKVCNALEITSRLPGESQIVSAEPPDFLLWHTQGPRSALHFIH